jgi:hypothetical protein
MFKVRRFSFRVVLLASLSVVLLLAGCDLISGGASSLDSDGDGITDDIEDIVSSEQLDAIENDLEVTVNRGTEPPSIEGQFYVSPVTLQATTVSGDSSTGSQFADVYLRLKNQDGATNTIEIDQVETNYITDAVIATAEGRGGYVIGENSKFSVFAQGELTFGSTTADVVYVYSGTMAGSGIQDYESAIYMLDNKGDPAFIANDTGRSFNDGDGSSPTTSAWPQ